MSELASRAADDQEAHGHGMLRRLSAKVNYKFLLLDVNGIQLECYRPPAKASVSCMACKQKRRKTIRGY